jgi:hypothetical protein
MDRHPAIRRLATDRQARTQWGPISAVALAGLLAVAILTDGAVPALWTTTLLLLTLPLDFATALWLTSPRSARS